MILIAFRWSWRPIESRLLTLPWSDLAGLTGSSSRHEIKFVEGLTDIEIFGIITGKVDSTFKLAWNFQENRVPSPRWKDQAQNLRNSHRWEHSHHGKFLSNINFFFLRKNDLSWRRRPWRICHVEGTHKPQITTQKSDQLILWFTWPCNTICSGRALRCRHQGDLHRGWSPRSQRAQDEGGMAPSLHASITDAWCL